MARPESKLIELTKSHSYCSAQRFTVHFESKFDKTLIAKSTQSEDEFDSLRTVYRTEFSLINY